MPQSDGGAIWEEELSRLYDSITSELHLSEPRLPRAVLVAEALAYFPGHVRPEDGYIRPNLAPPQEYMRRRLLGAGDGAAERDRLADEVATLRGGGTHIGLGTLDHRPRRSEEAGRKRRLERKRRAVASQPKF
jgi:hypothetical protein